MSGLWRRQVRGILRLEMKKNLLSARAIPVYLLALIPPFAAGVFILVSLALGTPAEFEGLTGASTIFAGLFQFDLVFIYFGCVWMFMNLFRGEVMDRSLHFYFLSPIRREVLAAGKYLAGWCTTTLLFGGSSAMAFLMLHGFLGGSSTGAFLLSGAGFGHLVAYVGVAALGCLGYGAVFLVVGLYLRNPLIPALVIFLWEGINFLLPPLLKRFSVIFYLQSLLPVPVSQGPFAVLANPASPWLAVPGLIVFTGLTLVLAAMRIRRMEISYGTD